jgi:putative ABC transport system substrate-binding protein
MMDRRTVIGVVAAAVVAAPLAASAQTATTVRRIGFLSSGARPSMAELNEETAPLRKLGWVEGKNLFVERRYTAGRAELLQPLAEELVRLKVELIVTFGTNATLAAKNATTTIPIIIKSAGDPARIGLVATLARPGGNITGYSIISPELNVKRLALLRELFPVMQSVAWLENSVNPYFRAARIDLEQACRSLGIQPIFVQVAAASELPDAVAEAARQRARALLVPTDTLFYEYRAEIMRAALKHALPTMAQRITVVEDGALIAYDPTLAEENYRNAAFIDRILHGAKPADLPIEQPTKFELIINLKTAKALGITIPPSLLLRADEVIE